MRTFANLFLFFFVADGLLSSIDDLLGLAFGIEALSPLRNLNALATLALALLIFVSLGIDRRLPKRIFLPLCVFLLWTTTGCWPLLGLIATQPLLLLASLLQLLLGGLVLAYQRHRSGSSIQLTQEEFHGASFSLGNTLGYFSLVLLALPLILGYTALATLNQELDSRTSGFMRISPVGLYMKERTYRLQEKTVRLNGMIHIGEKHYFQDLTQSLKAPRSIVLAEGVSDTQGLLTSRFDYTELGNVLGLTSQNEMTFDAHRVSLAEAPWEGTDPAEPQIAPADVDLSSFTPLTIEFLNQLGKLLTGKGPFAQNYASYNAWMESHMTPELYDTIMGDILDKRNAALLGHLNTALQHYDTVLIPWGAMHMPAVEELLLTRGFQQIDEQEHLSIRFASLPFAEISTHFGSSRQVTAESPGNPPSDQ
ncbi:MAG: hypothetical protein C0624_14950 [Desulfuromonas sp.]|nr:MAG: hypothetical protein C0624_14950 [Desulfuromonas sp.]